MAFAPKLLIHRVPRYEDARQPTLDGQIIFYETKPRVSEEEQRAKRRRIEKHAENYLRGHHPHIETAALQSVGDEKWQSPWKSAGFVPVKKPVFKPIGESISQSTPSKSSDQPQKRVLPRVPVKRKAKAKGKTMKHDTTFFKALHMAKQSSFAGTVKAKEKDVVQLSEAVNVDDLHQPDVVSDIVVKDVEAVEAPTADVPLGKLTEKKHDEPDSMHKHPDPEEPEISTLQTRAEDIPEPMIIKTPIQPQAVALLALEELGPTPPQPEGAVSIIDGHQELGQSEPTEIEAPVQPVQSPVSNRPVLNVDTSAVAGRTRSRTRKQIPEKTNTVTKDRSEEQLPSTSSHKSYIPSFPERQDSKAYSPTSFERNSEPSDRTPGNRGSKRTTLAGLPPPPAELPRKPEREDKSVKTHDYGLRRKRASFAEDLVAVQDENVEPIELSQDYYTPAGSQKSSLPTTLNQPPRKALRSCLRPIPKTDRRNNESPVSSQQFQIPSKDLSPTFARKQSVATMASDTTSVLALAFPSVSFLPSAEPQGTSAQDDTGSLMTWSFGQEEGQLEQGGLFGRFGLISGEEEEEEREIDLGVEEAVRFLEVDYNL